MPEDLIQEEENLNTFVLEQDKQEEEPDTPSRVIKKDSASVVLMTKNFKIEGLIHIMPGARLSDLMNRIDIQFIPVTEVRICTHDGREFMQTGFLALNKAEIIFVTPVEQLK